MKKLNATIGKIIFYVFVLAVFGWTASLTLAEMRAILPNDPITPFFALALFDGGALAWLMAWTGHARGLMQRSISAIMLVVCLAGVVLLSAGRLMDGGQEMVTVSSALSAAVIYGVIGATLANLAAIYAFHVSDPDTMEEIETGLLSDTLRAEAQKQATANIESQAKELGAILAARATGQLKYNLRLPMGTEEAAQANSFIDATAQDVTPADKSTTKNEGGNIISNWIRHTARKMQRVTQSAPVQAPEVITSAPEIIPNEAKPQEEAAKGAPVPVSRTGLHFPPHDELHTGEPLTYHPVRMQSAATVQPKAVPMPVLSPERARALNTPDGKPGHTVGDVVKSGLCSCPPIVFDESRDQPFSDEVQKVLGEKTKGLGIACLRETGQQEVWLDKSLCLGCPFYEQPTTEAPKGDSVFTEGMEGGER